MHNVVITVDHLQKMAACDVLRKIVRAQLHTTPLRRILVGHLNHSYDAEAARPDADRHEPRRLLCA